MNQSNKRILVVAAHPDDEILGCGGTVARLVQEGHEAFSFILGEGKTSRAPQRNVKKHQKDMGRLEQEMERANEIVGIKDVFRHDFPDNRLDAVPLLDVVKVIDQIKQKVNPDIIFTHHEKDLNVDHEVIYRAVITAARPLRGESVKEIYSFEVMSSTEWRFPLTFSPDVFFDISETIEKKVKAMEAYQSELLEYPHPRSLEGIRLTAQNWGMKVGVGYAEAFQTVRVVR